MMYTNINEGYFKFYFEQNMLSFQSSTQQRQLPYMGDRADRHTVEDRADQHIREERAYRHTSDNRADIHTIV